MNKPRQGLEETVSELPEKEPDAAQHFAKLLTEARALQRERGFSTTTDDDGDETGST